MKNNEILFLAILPSPMVEDPLKTHDSRGLDNIGNIYRYWPFKRPKVVLVQPMVRKHGATMVLCLLDFFHIRFNISSN